MTIVEFLNARLNEMECGIREALRTEDYGVSNFDLDDIESKRAVIAVVQGFKHYVVDEDCWFTCPAATGERDGGETCNDERRGGACSCGLEYRRMQILGPLASVYADHPDYNPEWKP